MSKSTRVTALIYTLVLAVIFGWIAHWKVFEFDIFWLVRAGREILQSGKVQTVESWSHTVAGSTWYNFQWLASVVLYGVSTLSNHYESLGWLRSILVGGWIGILILIIFNNQEIQGARRWVLPLILCPWIYLMCCFRLQMRPDLFAAFCFVSLIYGWHRIENPLKKTRFSFLILWIWANFHSGTVLVGVVISGIWIITNSEVPKKLQKLFILSLIPFLTPLHYHFLEVVWQNGIRYNYELSHNPDLQPFSWDLLHFKQGGMHFLLWFPYTALAFAGYVFWKDQPERFPKLYRNRAFVFLGACALTGLTFQKVRAIHYQVAFLLPVVAAVGNAALNRIKNSVGEKLASGLALAVFWGWLLPMQIQWISHPVGEGVLKTLIPVESVKFIQSTLPQGHILNSYDFGGYLIDQLPQYPVAIDGRERPFFGVIRELNQSRSNIQKYSKFLKDHKINLVMDRIPSFYFDPKVGMIDEEAIFYPIQEWALVFFDSASVIYLRRTPENEKIIAKYEYRFLRRGLPAGYAAQMLNSSVERQASAEAEFDQCLNRLPELPYCLTGKAAFSEKRGDLSSALALLQKAEAVDPRSPEVLLALSGVYQRLGQLDLSQRVLSRFQHLTHPL